ncbi:MAG: hypothetical protein ACJA07_004451, partial [Rhodococcus sp. (in: high G+C Gram-positive bacteria)]
MDDTTFHRRRFTARPRIERCRPFDSESNGR